MSNRLFFVGDNFVTDSFTKVTDSDLRSLETIVDHRSLFVSKSIDTTNWEWYYNYLNLNAQFASLSVSNPIGSHKRNPTVNDYLLRYGYIPMIFLPQNVGSGPRGELQAILDTNNIEYIVQKSISFINPEYYTEEVDAWVSKLDLSEKFGIKPEMVRSADIWRRLL